MMMKDGVSYVKYGIGHTINGQVFLNINLLKYPDLHKKVLDHELKHVRGEAHVDFKEKIDIRILKFIISHPSTWVQFLPVWIRVGHNQKILFTYDRTVAMIWYLLLFLAGSFAVTLYHNEYGLVLAVLNIFNAVFALKWLK